MARFCMSDAGAPRHPNTADIASSPIQKIHIDDLKFDLNNVRLSHLAIKNSQNIQESLEEIGEIDQLKQRIIAAKVVFEPLVVTPDFVVIEGNRRLAACRSIVRDWKENVDDFNNKYSNLDIDQFSNLKCKMLPKNIDKTTVAIYLISTHMRTKKPWQLFNRATYLYKLYVEYHWTYEDIASQGFMSKSTAIKTVNCYELTMKYKKKYSHEDPSWSKKYIYYWQLLTNKKLVEFRKNKSNVLEFTSWLSDKKFRNHTQIKDLPDIMSDPSAFTAFKKISSKRISGESYKQAMDILDKNDPAVNDKTFKHIKKMTKMIQGFTRSEISEIFKDAKKMSYLFELHNEVYNLVVDIKRKNKQKKLIN